MARAERGSRRLWRLHRLHDPRSTCEARQPRALVRRAAVEIAAEPVFEEEGVEVQQQPVAYRSTLIRRAVYGMRWTPDLPEADRGGR